MQRCSVPARAFCAFAGRAGQDRSYKRGSVTAQPGCSASRPRRCGSSLQPAAPRGTHGRAAKSRGERHVVGIAPTSLALAETAPAWDDVPSDSPVIVWFKRDLRVHDHDALISLGAFQGSLPCS